MTSVSSSIFVGFMSTISGMGMKRVRNQPSYNGEGGSYKLTEALISYLQIPEIDAEIVGRKVRFLVRIDADGVNMVSVSVGKNTS